MKPVFILAALLPGLSSMAAHAQFALAVSPPRFELGATPGQTLREVIELSQAQGAAGRYTLKTADWTLRPDGAVDFSEALQPGSCRPWVAIERRELSVAPGRPYRFRFEVSPPADAPPAECRFAILIEGQEQTTGSEVPVAMAARIGVIVYVRVGAAAPVLELAGSAVQTVDGQPTPVLMVRNSGTAHGRLAGFLKGRDASGSTLEFQATDTPILPGETRTIALVATRSGDTETLVQPSYPVIVQGQLEWGRDGTFRVDQRFAP